MKILILNSFSRNGLSVINALGGKYSLYGANPPASRFRTFLQDTFFHSRHLIKSTRYTPPSHNPEKFKEDLVSICKSHNIDAVIPTGTISTNYLSFYKKDIENCIQTKLIVENFETFKIFMDKWLTYQLCLQLNIPAPKTILLTKDTDCIDKVRSFSFPIVAKPRVSYASNGVFFFQSIDEFIQGYESLVHSPRGGIEPENAYIIQEQISGHLHDTALCAKNGMATGIITQQRVVTYRDFGGGGIINLTTNEPIIKDYARKLIKEIAWNGPALFDFIKDSDGNYSLLEVNPKIWGTTQLSILAGANIPLLMLNTFTSNSNPTEDNNYEENLLYKWIFPECISACLQSPLTFKKLFQRAKKMIQNHNASRIVTNLKINDIKHALGIVLQKL